ncbi:MAG: diguanylate cyclase [Selenomonadaceae bacterium]|nr:diguanylate cyclase [Selenomonadaceae bacterium]
MEEDTDFIHSKILHEISDGVIYLQEGKILYVNLATLEILDKKMEDLIGKPFAGAFLEYSENDDFNQMLLDVVYDDTQDHEKIVQYFTGEKMKTLHIKTSAIHSENFGIVILMDDLTELMKLREVALDFENIKKINEQLSKARDFYKKNSEIDKLTGLLNKIAFEKICKRTLKTFSQEDTAAFFVIDLDYFKEANDTYGHQFGDEILKKFSMSLKKLFVRDSFIGRFGGDEFVILLEKVSDENFVVDKAKKICEIASTMIIDDQKVRLSASIGIVIFSGSEKDYDKIFETADKSVYIVKSHGKNGFSINLSDKNP